MVIRKPDLTRTMSANLIKQIATHSYIKVVGNEYMEKFCIASTIDGI